MVPAMPPSAGVGVLEPAGAFSAGEETPAETPGEADLDQEEIESSLSLAALGVGSSPKVLETFDNVADAYKRLRRLQEQDIEFRLNRHVAFARAGSADTRSSSRRSSPR